MKLIHFKLTKDYIFDLNFEDGTNTTVDLSPLIYEKVSKEELKSANIDKDWGCLEFKDGLIDIEPKTLYNFANSGNASSL
jgi:hypothetical protein